MKWPKTYVGLTKSLDPLDYTVLEDDLKLVDAFPIGHEQHPHRRWEYAMCVRAIRCWNLAKERATLLYALDVGGAGSTMKDVLLHGLRLRTHVIDPRADSGITLEELVSQPQPLTVPRSAPVVFSISTIEHVKNVEKFIEHLAEATKPGGLLFLTTDVQAAGPDADFLPDRRHFHWMRERIYTLSSWRDVGRAFHQHGFRYFGPPDWTYHGDHVYDYSFASMALVKGAP